jgi:predicted nucleic acid-binding protein
MKRIFADTSYWIALLNPHDELHGRAVALAQSCSDDQIVTTEMMLTELLNGY